MLEPERNEREAQAADKSSKAARGAGEAGGAEKKEVNPLFDWVSAVVTAVLTVVLVFTFLAQLISVEGPSMQPTLYQGDRLIVLNRAFCDFAQSWQERNPQGNLYADYFAPLLSQNARRFPQHQPPEGGWLNWPIPGSSRTSRSSRS